MKVRVEAWSYIPLWATRWTIGKEGGLGNLVVPTVGKRSPNSGEAFPKPWGSVTLTVGKRYPNRGEALL